MMNKLTNTKSMIWSRKDEFDDSSSLTSSTLTYRLSRKKDQQSSSRKSLSRKSSEKTLGELDVSRFYVKMNQPQEPQPKSPPRKNILTRIEQPLTIKKRSPTPLPGHNRRKNSEKPQVGVQPIETDLLIAELQQRCKEEKDAKEVFQKRVRAFEQDIKAKLSKIQQLQTLYTQSIEREQASQLKLKQYQQIISINETNLNEAKSSLQKLKNTIKQNRYAQIESDNARLTAENAGLKQSIVSLQQQREISKEQICKLKSQISILKAVNQGLTKYSSIEEKNKEIQQLRQIISSSKSSREEELQKCLRQGTQQREKLKLAVNRLQIQLNYIARKKSQELQTFKENKNALIAKLRCKISGLHTQNSSLREQISKLKEQKSFLPLRKNALMETSENTLFELTPQKCQA